MRKRFLAILLALCLVIGLLPTMVLAADEDNTVTVLNLSGGSITITKEGYTQGENGEEVSHSGPYQITGGSAESPVSNTITIESGANAQVTIKDVTIKAENSPAIFVEAGATLNLTVVNTNTLTGGPGCAAICVEPAYDADNGYAYDPDNSAALNISGTGSLTAKGGDGDKTRGMFGGGAGIGGNSQNFDNKMGGVDFGIIEVSEDFAGEISASGGQAYNKAGKFGSNTTCSFGGGAGIGSGGFDCANFDWQTVCGRIKIQSGTIIANQGLENVAVGAGIGSGTGGLSEAWETDSSDITITITGGTINAQGGGLSAGIGGGSLCDGGNVKISGGTVIAKAGAADGAMGASGIGGGNDGGVLYEIAITGGEVTAIASGGSAGIGGASNTSNSNLQYGDENGTRSEGKIGKISISGESTTVNAYGGTGSGITGTFGGAGIGSGYPTANNTRSVAFDISITGGATVNAYGGYHAQAIGYGYRPNTSSPADYYTGYGIKLALDDTITLWAQNADYFQPALVAATQYDNAPITYQSENTYLVCYTAESRDATEVTSYNAKAYLDLTKEAETFDWSYVANKLSIEGTEVAAVEGLKGNWATLYTPAPTTYTVTFDANGGAFSGNATTATVTVEDSKTVTAPTENPTREGYTFGGWYKETGCINAWDFAADTVKSDVTLYAKWTVKTYTVTFDSQGGSAVDSATVEYGSTVNKPTDPTRTDYAFVGWYEEAACTNEWDFENDTVTADITLYAKWTKNGGGGGGGTTYYTLHYESNGGTEYKDERYAKNTVVQLDKVPTREGYVFTGWYADEALTEPITSIKMTSDKTVYAGWRASTVPDWLNGEDHFAYIIGYSDGTVRPNANISRAEVATIFFRLLDADIRDGNLTSESSFEDVTEGMWCNKSISTMAALGIVKGRTAAAFDPDTSITRAEFAAICARFDTGLTDGDSEFTDISGHWAEAEIERAVSLGWIQGYGDGTFRPDQYITRAEAMTIINRVLCRIPENEDDLLDGMNIWPDNLDTTKWYYLAVQEATNSHDYRHKGEIYETWIDLNTDPDWTRYQN